MTRREVVQQSKVVRGTCQADVSHCHYRARVVGAHTQENSREKAFRDELPGRSRNKPPIASIVPENLINRNLWNLFDLTKRTVYLYVLYVHCTVSHSAD